MKITTYFLVLLVVFSRTCFAQSPRIDSIYVDEDKGELVLQGLFTNSASAIVTVDSFLLSVTMASDTLIRALIPVEGNGWAGIVKVTLHGSESNYKLLTVFHFRLLKVSSHIYSNGTEDYLENNYVMHIRLDLSDKTKRDVQCTRKSRFVAKAWGLGVMQTYDSIGSSIEAVHYDGVNEFYCDFQIDRSSSIQAYVKFDKDFAIISERSWGGGFKDLCAPGGPYSGTGYCIDWYATAPTDFPPLTLDVLQKSSYPNILVANLSSNPVQTNTEAIVTLRENMNVRIEIMDILGNVRQSDERMLSAGENRLPVNASALAAGVYICRLQAGGEVMSLRFVKE